MSEYRITFKMNEEEPRQLPTKKHTANVKADNIYHALNKMQIIVVNDYGSKIFRITNVELIREDGSNEALCTEELEFINSADMVRRIS